MIWVAVIVAYWFAHGLLCLMGSCALNHNGRAAGKGPGDKYWDYSETPAAEIGLTRPMVWFLWASGLWIPGSVAVGLAQVFFYGPGLVLKMHREDKAVLMKAKKNEVAERKKRIEKEYNEVIMEFEKWEKETKNCSQESSVSTGG